jgi:hypothetical protein
MSILNGDNWKTGTWILLLAFILVAILAPATGPLAVLTETFILIVILGIISVLNLPSKQFVCPVYSVRIHPRAPPVR